LFLFYFIHTLFGRPYSFSPFLFNPPLSSRFFSPTLHVPFLHSIFALSLTHFHALVFSHIFSLTPFLWSLSYFISVSTFLNIQKISLTFLLLYFRHYFTQQSFSLCVFSIRISDYQFDSHFQSVTTEFRFLSIEYILWFVFFFIWGVEEKNC